MEEPAVQLALEPSSRNGRLRPGLSDMGERAGSSPGSALLFQVSCLTQADLTLINGVHVQQADGSMRSQRHIRGHQCSVFYAVVTQVSGISPRGWFHRQPICYICSPCPNVHTRKPGHPAW